VGGELYKKNKKRSGGIVIKKRLLLFGFGLPSFSTLFPTVNNRLFKNAPSRNHHPESISTSPEIFCE
jgi:hypothetical protein